MKAGKKGGLTADGRGWEGKNQNPKNKNQGNSKVQGKTAVARNRLATVDLPRRPTLRVAERPREGSRVASAHGMKRQDRRLRRGATPDPPFSRR